ncbi:MAG: PadR family transcriptional regulator [Candidatus Gastranaerophilaceae bacterium]|jgi:DNA-binding PadR family transcriptional regulator
MIVELIILFTLKTNSLNIYEIKKFIDDNFSLFYKISFGTLYPALKRLSINGYLDVEKKISEGGQRQSLYKITEKGFKYFYDLLTSDICDNISFTIQLVDIFVFIIADKSIDKTVLNKAKENLIKFLELKKIEMMKFLKKVDNSDSLAKYINISVDNFDEKIKYLKK